MGLLGKKVWRREEVLDRRVMEG
jgi:hypothetical protein